MNAKEALELVAILDDLKPLARKVVDVIDEASPETYRLMHKFAIGLASLKVETFRHYIGEGFTREEALVLTASQWKEMMDATQRNRQQQTT